MSAKPATAQIYALQLQEDSPVPTTPCRAELLNISTTGSLLVRAADQREYCCDWLENSHTNNIHLEPGDQLLVMPPSGQEPGIVLGRIGRYTKPQTPDNLTLEANESLTLKCGAASVELRRDGKAMLKGEDVLLRAKGTQRIRAGTVAIN